MKKLYYLIVLALILGLVLTGCSLLSNISQVPATGQSGITYLTKGPLSTDLVNLVGLWHFDEGSGTTANDSSGNPNDGTLMGDTSWTSGKFGDALSFDGDGDYVDFGSGVTASITGDYTVEAWIKPASLDSGRHVVMSFRYMELGCDAGKVYFWQAYDSSWGKGYEYTSPTVLLDLTKFFHIVGVFHEDAGVDLYVDGIYIGSDTDKTGTTLNIFSKTYAGVWYTAGGGWFDGIIDEVRIWDKALTAEQIEDSFNYGIVIQKGMSQDDAVLGDIIITTLEVVTATAPLTVVDTLPSELRYIPGTFEVNGVPATPTVVGQTIPYNLPSPCAYTITFDAQVTSAEAEDNTVTNTAMANGVSASAELTIYPYEGFTKDAAVPHDEDEDGIIEVGEEIIWDVTIAVTNILGDEITLMSDIVVQDRFGGELEINSFIVNSGTLEIKLSGKTDKPKIKWDDFSLSDGTSETANLTVSTDVNPGGQHSYSTAGEYEMNSGAVLKFIDSEGTGFQLSAHTPQITVVVFEPN